jgi:phospholipase/carboxylesterase
VTTSRPEPPEVERLDGVERETGPRPAAAVIWLHGLGADGHDFVPVAEALGLPAAPAIRFVFPHAPIRAVTINAGLLMRAWYDVQDEGGVRREDARGVRESQAHVEGLIRREGRRGIPPERIVLAGFSQGGAVALQTGLRYPDRLAGILALSTFLPLADTLGAEVHPANRDVPVFLAHGTADALIPLSRGRDARDRLLALGYRVDWRQYRMPHAVSDAEIADIAAWLRGVLALG